MNPNIQIPEINIANVERLFKKIVRIVVILAIPILLVAYWLFHPAINVHSESTWYYVMAFLCFPVWGYFKLRSLLTKAQPGSKPVEPSGTDEQGRLRATSVNTSTAKKAEAQVKLFNRISYLPIAVLVLFVVGYILSSAIVPGNAARYANIISVDSRDFSTDIQEIN